MADEQARILEEQKKQCPFCKILKGEIPSKKIFESKGDGLSKGVCSVLDINPASEGHALIMPNEHYPILPLIPPETAKELFLASVKISEIERVLFVKEGTTIFIANGAAAGQQSSHFMIHVIARDSTNLTNLNVKGRELNEKKVKEVYETLSHNLNLMLGSLYNKHPLRDTKGNPIPLKKRFSKNQVISIIENNPQLKNAIIKEPIEFIKSIPLNNQLNEIFGDIDPEEIIKHYIPNFNPDDYKINQEKNSKKEINNDVHEKKKGEDVSIKENFKDKKESQLKEDNEIKIFPKIGDLIKFIRENKQLYEFIKTNPEKFKESLPNSKKISKMFENFDVDEVISRIDEVIPEPPKKSDKIDKNKLDDISRLF